jgi:RND family efflux transporter MFP subunit
MSLLTVLLVLPLGCNRDKAVQGSGQQKDSAKLQETAPPPALVRMTFTRKIEAPGEIQADEQTLIFTKISGYVKKWNKDIGDRVATGEILAELSVPEFDEELLQKEALVVQAKAELDRARKLHRAAVANVQVAEARVKEALAALPRAQAELTRAESTYDRLKKNASVIAEEAIAETKLGFEAAKAAIGEVEAKIKSAEAWQVESIARRDTAFSDIAVAESRVRVAEATARNMQEILKYAKLPAPYDGVVVKRNVDLGDLIHSSAKGTKGEPVFILARLDPVRIYVDVPENDAVLIKDGTKAAVRVQALGGEQFQGVVKRSSWALDPRGRILRTEIDLPNPEGRLRPGMYAYATISVVHENVWAVPASAIVTRDHQTYCNLVENGKAQLTPVVIGLRDGQFIEVIRKQGRGGEGTWRAFTGKEEIASATEGRE